MLPRSHILQSLASEVCNLNHPEQKSPYLATTQKLTKISEDIQSDFPQVLPLIGKREIDVIIELCSLELKLIRLMPQRYFCASTRNGHFLAHFCIRATRNQLNTGCPFASVYALCNGL